MISDRLFCSYYSSAWRDVCPNTESVLRVLNLTAKRVQRPHRSGLVGRRDLISETGFSYYEYRVGRGLLSHEALARASVDALARITGYRGHAVESLSDAEAADATVVEAAIQRYISRRFKRPPDVFRPRFSGCGVIDSAEGDLIVGDALVEIKYVDRPFRSIDLRQCILYLALNYAAGGDPLERIVLFNAYEGKQIDVRVETLAYAVGGQPSHALFDELLRVASGGEMSK